MKTNDRDLYPRIQRQLRAAVRRAYRKQGSVRKAAEFLGMPRSTFHDLLVEKASA